MLNIRLTGKPYQVLKAEAEALNVTTATLARAILSRVAMDAMVRSVVEGVDLTQFGKGKDAVRAPGRKSSKKRDLMWEGRSVTLTELAELCGIPYQTLRMRLERGWSIDKATSAPSQPGRKP